MSKSGFTITLFCFCFIVSKASTDTLRHIDKNQVLINATTNTIMAERFDVPAPLTLSKVLITLSGGTGTGVMQVFGHEAGLFYPGLKKDIITPINFTKNATGVQQIELTLPAPVFFDNNQFFIAVSSLSSGVFLMQDTTSHSAFCSSSSGGYYYYQYQYKGTTPWSYTAGSYAIEALVDIPVKKMSQYYFKDVTSLVGIDGLQTNKRIATADYDEDGWVDILSNGRLYKNMHNDSSKFVDVTSAVGLVGTPLANAFIDMDNDGKLDIVFFGVGKPDSSFLYKNEGNGKFVRSFLSGVPSVPAISSFSFADLNYDKYPDVIIAQLWVTYPNALPNYLLFNNGKLDFTNKSTLLYPGNPASKRSRGTNWVDFDDDGDQDLYITNYYLEKDEFYRNNGDGTFTNIITSKGIDYNKGTSHANHGTGVDWWDYDNDGDMDLLLPQFAHPGFVISDDHQTTTIYRNGGAPAYDFSDLKGQHGMQFEETHASATFGDANNDGLVDLYITTFYGCRYVDLYLQKPDHTFELKTWEFGIDSVVSGQDGVWFDFNNDGKLDLLGGDNNRIKLYMNQVPDVKHYVFIRLKSKSANANAIGAKVTVFANGNKYTQEVTAGRGLNMQRPFNLHFGLGEATTVDSVVVRWPVGDNSLVEVFKGVKAEQLNILEEGQGVTEISSVNFDPFRLVAYPNPFDHETTISLSRSTSVYELIITDIAGRVIEKNSISSYSPVQIGDNYLPGVYFVRLSGLAIQRELKIVKY